jgi:hypothetical protein
MNGDDNNAESIAMPDWRGRTSLAAPGIRSETTSTLRDRFDRWDLIDFMRKSILDLRPIELYEHLKIRSTF